MLLLQSIWTTTHLGGNRMTSSREQLGDASSLETSFCETEGSPQTCTTCSAVSQISEKLNGLQNKSELTQRQHRTRVQ
jgi:hypothetical protein